MPRVLSRSQFAPLRCAIEERRTFIAANSGSYLRLNAVTEMRAALQRQKWIDILPKRELPKLVWLHILR